MVTSGGALGGGTAKLATRTATGTYTVTFARDVSACTYTATLGRREERDDGRGARRGQRHGRPGDEPGERRRGEDLQLVRDRHRRAVPRPGDLLTSGAAGGAPAPPGHRRGGAPAPPRPPAGWRSGEVRNV